MRIIFAYNFNLFPVCLATPVPQAIMRLMYPILFKDKNKVRKEEPPTTDCHCIRCHSAVLFTLYADTDFNSD